MSPDNKIETNPLGFLSLLEQEMVEKMCQVSGLTPVEQVRQLIRRRAFGHLKDLGDDRGSFRLYETDLPGLRVEKVDIQR